MRVLLAAVLVVSIGCNKKSDDSASAKDKATESSSDEAATTDSGDALKKGALDLMREVQAGDLDAARKRLVGAEQCPALFPKDEMKATMCKNGVAEMNQAITAFAEGVKGFPIGEAVDAPNDPGAPPTARFVEIKPATGGGSGVKIAAVEQNGHWYYMFPMKRGLPPPPPAPDPSNDDDDEL